MPFFWDTCRRPSRDLKRQCTWLKQDKNGSAAKKKCSQCLQRMTKTLYRNESTAKTIQEKKWRTVKVNNSRTYMYSTYIPHIHISFLRTYFASLVMKTTKRAAPLTAVSTCTHGQNKVRKKPVKNRKEVAITSTHLRQSGKQQVKP